MWLRTEPLVFTIQEFSRDVTAQFRIYFSFDSTFSHTNCNSLLKERDTSAPVCWRRHMKVQHRNVVGLQHYFDHYKQEA